MNDSNVGTLPKSVKDGIYDFLKYRDSTYLIRKRSKFDLERDSTNTSLETNSRTNPLLNI
ncbi:hypothetical protein LEP1GSC040_1175 [Leptospira santarosai str. 2000030832]|nr:hypothetical protein LEP1GSC040_1175 [Leptospira santarosai str. 2000030832]